MVFALKRKEIVIFLIFNLGHRVGGNPWRNFFRVRYKMANISKTVRNGGF